MRAYLTCCFLVLISPARAKYFSDWIKADAFGADTKTYVCEMWIRDKNIFDNIGKVSGMGCIIVRLVQCIVDLGPRTGIPHDGQQELDPPTDGVESRRPRPTCFEMGVDVPYILFSRHHWMKDMPIPQGTRWNEMAIYRQTQDALLLTIPLTPERLGERIQRNFMTYESQIKAWNITVPPDTWADFQKAKEDWIKP